MKGVIFDIQHFSVHDGPGIRSTVFLKGCQLHCLWCHNPESILTRKHELSYVPQNCMGCGNCFRVCKNNAHIMKGLDKNNNEHFLDRDKCKLCGECTFDCPTKALSLCGKEIDAEEVMEEVLRDKAFYDNDGGLTISGGEPLVQKAFTEELTKIGRENNLHITLETNLCYPYEWLNNIKERINLFLVDWKESDNEKHKQYTGVGNEELYNNIVHLHDEGFSVLLRCPIIPGHNDREDHFNKIAEMTSIMPKLLGAEILPYHNLGLSKIERFGFAAEAFKAEQPKTETVEKWIRYIRDQGGRLVNE